MQSSLDNMKKSIFMAEQTSRVVQPKLQQYGIFLTLNFIWHWMGGKIGTNRWEFNWNDSAKAIVFLVELSPVFYLNLMEQILPSFNP